MELEATARSRLEGQLARLREAHEQLTGELAAAKQREQQTVDEVRKITRQLRDLKEENLSLNAKLSEAARARVCAAALQEAIAGDLSSPADSKDSDSENDSYSSDESIGTFLANHKLSPSAPSRNSIQLESQRSQTSEGRQSRSSVGSGSKPLSPTKESFA